MERPPSNLGYGRIIIHLITTPLQHDVCTYSTYREFRVPGLDLFPSPYMHIPATYTPHVPQRAEGGWGSLS